jgi:A/G-specific adenine glycosylase
VPEAEFGVAVVAQRVDGELRLFLVRRPEEGLLGGLWEFPAEEPVTGEDAGAAARRAAERCPEEVGAAGMALETVRHAFSHFRARYRPTLFEIEAGAGAGAGAEARAGAGAEPGAGSEPGPDDSAGRWFAAGALKELALPVAQRRIARAALEALEGG